MFKFYKALYYYLCPWKGDAIEPSFNCLLLHLKKKRSYVGFPPSRSL